MWCMNVCLCASFYRCMFIYIVYMYVYVPMCIGICMCACVCVCIDLCVYISVFVYVCLYIYIYIYIYMFMWVFCVYMYTYMYIHTHICVCMHMYVLWIWFNACIMLIGFPKMHKNPACKTLRAPVPSWFWLVNNVIGGHLIAGQRDRSRTLGLIVKGTRRRSRITTTGKE
jgi:hypothetical protein